MSSLHSLSGQSNSVQSLWRMLDRLRGQTPVGSQADILAPLAALLFLRWAGKFEAEQEAVAAFDGTDFEATLPVHLRWEALQMADPGGLELALRQSGPKSEQHNVVAAHLETALDELSAKKLQPLLAPLFQFVDGMPFETPSELAAAEATLAGLIPNASRKTGWYAFEYYTPEPVCELMVALADPQPGDRIYDPCFGVGGLLVESARRLRDKSKQLPPRSWIDLGQNTFYGVELNQRAHLIGLTRLLLLGFHRPGLQVGDALLREPYSNREKFSCVLAVPPWGAKRPRDHALNHFPVRSRDTLNLFVQHVAMSLRTNGRAVIAAPNGFLFKTGADRQTRTMLLKNFCLEGVVSLPESSFAPYTTMGGNLLLLRKRAPKEVVRFLRVPDLAGVGGAGNEAAAYAAEKDTQPEAIAATFFGGKPSALLWDTPVKELAQRDWDLQVRRSGSAELGQFLQAVTDMDEGITHQLLDKFAEVSAGIAYSRRSTTVRPEEGLIPLVRVADLTDRRVKPPDLFLLPQFVESVANKHVFSKSGDILLSTSGTIGKTGVVGADLEGMRIIPTKSIASIRPRKGVLAEYLFALLRSGCYQRWLRGHARGARIQHLSVNTLRNLQIPIPALQMQARFIDYFSNRGGDGAEAFLEFLSGVEADPFIAWLDQDADVAALLDLGVDRVFTGDEAAARYLPHMEAVARKLGDEAFKYAKWCKAKNYTHTALAELCQQLAIALKPACGIASAPPGVAQYAILQNTRALLHPLGRPREQTASRAERKLSQLAAGISDMLERLLWSRVYDAKVGAPTDSYTVPVGAESEVSLTLTNQGILPMLDCAVGVLSDDPVIDVESVTVRETCWSPGNAVTLKVRIPALAKKRRIDLKLQVLYRHISGSPYKLESSEGIIVWVSDRAQARKVVELGLSPYNGQSPVQDRGMFFGRTAVRDRIKVQLEKQHPADVILLLGNRRMGKTSILNRLRSGEWLQNHFCVYCSFQGVTDLRTEALFRHMLTMMGQQAFDCGLETWHPNAPPKLKEKPFKKEFKDSLVPLFSGGNPLSVFETCLEHLLALLDGKRLLLMLDEFDKVQEGISEGITNALFPDNLRYLVHTYSGLSLMLVGSPQVKSVRNRYWSPLFGLGETISVGPLEPAEAKQLVTAPVPELSYAPAAVARIVELCACRANLTQKLCDQVFTLSKEQGRDKVTIELVEQAARDVTVDNEHFATLWDEDCHNNRQRFILCLCARMASGGSSITFAAIEDYLENSRSGIGSGGLEKDIEHLCDAQILLLDRKSTAGAYRIAVPLMQRWLLDRDFEVQQRKAEREALKGYQ